MIVVRKVKGKFEIIPDGSSIVAKGVTHPWNVTAVWSDEELAKCNVYRVAVQAPPAEGLIPEGDMKFEEVNGAVIGKFPTWRKPLPDGNFRERILELEDERALQDRTLEALWDVVEKLQAKVQLLEMDHHGRNWMPLVADHTPLSHMEHPFAGIEPIRTLGDTLIGGNEMGDHPEQPVKLSVEERNQVLDSPDSAYDLASVIDLDKEVKDTISEAATKASTKRPKKSGKK
jgi:hypothetical protein